MTLCENIDDQTLKELCSIAFLRSITLKGKFKYDGCDPPDIQKTDCSISVVGQLDPDDLETDAEIKVQLKATSQDIVYQTHNNEECLTYALEADTHRRLATRHSLLRFVFVMFLPQDFETWITHDFEGNNLDRLTLEHYGMYWYLPILDEPTTNVSTQTIYIPKRNRITVESLRNLLKAAANAKDLTYLERGFGNGRN